MIRNYEKVSKSFRRETVSPRAACIPEPSSGLSHCRHFTLLRLPRAKPLYASTVLIQYLPLVELSGKQTLARPGLSAKVTSTSKPFPSLQDKRRKESRYIITIELSIFVLCMAPAAYIVLPTVSISITVTVILSSGIYQSDWYFTKISTVGVRSERYCSQSMACCSP
eukprot:g30901.t1